jgi:hypothetical protein
MKRKQVKILKAKYGTTWYADKIGETFHVHDRYGWWMIDMEYHQDNYYNEKGVFPEDVEFIDENAVVLPKDMFKI